MVTTVADHSNISNISANLTAPSRVYIESLGPKSKIQIKQPGYSPLFASLVNTWQITEPQHNLRKGPQMHFIATTEADERIPISQDLIDGAWYMQR